MSRSPRYAAIAGSPRVTNRGGVITTMQMLETASLIGLMRRTHALAGRVGTVAGVLGLFRRDAVLAVGGYDAQMATEDIELTWRLLEAGHLTGFEPHALVGMEVPQTLRGIWALEAAAIAGRPVRLLSLLALGEGLVEPEDCDRLPALRAQPRSARAEG